MFFKHPHHSMSSSKHERTVEINSLFKVVVPQRNGRSSDFAARRFRRLPDNSAVA